MIDDLQKYANQLMQEQNNRAIPDFEGYSPIEMHYILHDTFGEKSPLKFEELSSNEYQEIPILNQIKFLTNHIAKEGELKLTNKGFLPPKVVTEIYNQGFLKDGLIELGISKLRKESDSQTVNLTKILIEISGLVKKRNNKLSLTKNGEKLLSDDHKLLWLIFNTFATKFNWAYYDGYGENHIGQLGIGFTLVLISKYGHENRMDKFYADKYFKAFPHLLESINPILQSVERQVSHCYSVRTFYRFLFFFGLIKIESEGKWESDSFIRKTILFDKLIKVSPHKVYSLNGEFS